MGNSNVRHNISNAEGRIIRSPERILANALAKNDAVGVRNRALYAQALRATMSLATFKDSYNSL
jgi:hypothetical protein